MKNNNRPLADRMRPQNWNEFFGQKELVSSDSHLRKSIDQGDLFSMIFWGPPGTGKTTLAWMISKKTDSNFEVLSAVSSGVKDLRKIIEKARENLKYEKNTILFIDEIHRWNKSQQDALLPHVEKGTLILIGATTENPSFEVNSALLSRLRVFVLKSLEKDDIEKIIELAISDKKRGLGNEKIKINLKTLSLLANLSNGDARVALNVLEACASQSDKIDEKLVKEVFQKSNLFYDKDGEEHYNIISALHKSMRGGDSDASLYWLSRMLEGGEDPLYIARRLVRFASEDIGLADNFALVLANNVYDSCHKLGMPECSVHLAQCVVYLARAKKSVAVYLAYQKAKEDTEKFGNLAVPLHIRNAPTKLMKEIGYGKGYKYTPLEDSSEQTYFPKELLGRKYIKFKTKKDEKN